MGWEKLLKRRKKATSLKDIRAIKYVMRDGNFRTADTIMDEIYELIQENKKLGTQKLVKLKGRPAITSFGASKAVIKWYMTNSPEFESRDTGNKTLVGTPIIEFRYIGVR